MTDKTNSGRRGAFSLVEVVVAMGILSFAMIAVIGLLPASLTNLRQASDRTVETQIVKGIGNRVLLTPFPQLAGFTNYYTVQGEGSSVPGEAIYCAQVSVENASYPAMPAGAEARLKSVVIRIRSLPFEGPSLQESTYALMVARAEP